MSNKKNIKYWNKIESSYRDQWVSYARQRMSDRETDFIKKYLKKNKPSKILDIGIGTGRILDNLIDNSTKKASIYGLDLTKKMVNYCKTKYSKNDKVKKLVVCDISKQKIFYAKDRFDLITAIRVLKYSRNWPEIIKNIYVNLNRNGLFVFTMPNYNSINRLVKHNIPVYRSTVKEIRSILNKNNYEILEIRGISKIPDIFYGNKLRNNKFYIYLLIKMEEILESILGKTFLGRMLFIACRKK
jgi:ubiquinone/menaquinone biosynthesis C-methylase UbiE